MPCHSCLPSALCIISSPQSDRKLDFPSFLGDCCHLSLIKCEATSFFFRRHDRGTPIPRAMCNREEQKYICICTCNIPRSMDGCISVFKEAFPHVPLFIQSQVSRANLVQPPVGRFCNNIAVPRVRSRRQRSVLGIPARTLSIAAFSGAKTYRFPHGLFNDNTRVAITISFPVIGVSPPPN
jgi:hypothetical protein